MVEAASIVDLDLSDFQGMPNVSSGYSLVAKSIHDIQIDIAGVYFPLRSMSYSKTMTVDEEYGSGDHDPWALTNKQHAYSGTFEYASYLKNGDVELAGWERLALESLLEDAEDQGQPKYFRILIMDRSKGSNQAPSYGDFVEALLYCKLTKSGRNYQENNDVVTQREFKFMRRIPA